MTIGWKLEGDRDRFLAARDPVPNPQKTRPSFGCPFCHQIFSERDALNLHVQSSHMIKRPFLLIHGIEPSTEDTIRRHLDRKTIELFNCTTLLASLNGQPLREVQARAFCNALCNIERATARLRLINAGDGLSEPVAHEYNLKIFAPAEPALVKVEKLFLAVIAKDSINLARLQSFYDETRKEAAAEYAEALADYVRAVLIKDGDINTGVSTRVGHYREIQTRALQTLEGFDRPLSKLFSGLIRFDLNDFSQWREETGLTRLDRAYQMLGPLTQPDSNGGTAKKREIGQANGLIFVCPVDLGTDTVTRLAEQAAELPRWGSAVEEQFNVVAEQANFDPLDSVKIRAQYTY